MRCDPPGRSAAAPMIVAALTIRLFGGMITDDGGARNAVWLCPLAGLALFVPLALAIRQADRVGNDCGWNNLSAELPRALSMPVALLFALCLICDCGFVQRLMANTASVMALGDVSIPLLVLPTSLMIFACVLLGADAEGHSARLWLHFVPFLALIMLLVQLKHFVPQWLTPLLGAGLAPIADGGVNCGGWMALIALSWLNAVPDRARRGPLPYAVIAALTAGALLLTLQMLYPALLQSELTRAAKIELLLSNGRVALSLQLPLIVLWYGNLLHLAATEAVVAAGYIQRAFPKWPRWLIAALEALGTLLLGASRFAMDAFNRVLSNYLFLAIGGGVALLMLAKRLRKGGKGACAPSSNT